MGKINLGNITVSAFKVGNKDCKVYLGDTLLYPTTFQGKWIATYAGGTTSSAECDSSSAITQNEINKTNLVSVELGDCVTSIGNSAFYNCRNLTSCTIGSGVTSIGTNAFYSCRSLTGIIIPSGVTSIGTQVFRDCRSLTSVTVNATTPPTLGSDVFYSTNDYPIYVPSGSVSAYQSAWSYYASRIQAIP